MAPPRKVARDLRRSAQRIAKIPDESVAAAATYAVETGASVGGTFGGRRGRSPLTVVVRSTSRRKGQASATVAGKTAAAWSIKSYGRRSATIRPNPRRRRHALDLRGTGTARSAYAEVRPAPTTGDDRWNRRVAEPTTDAFAELFVDLVDDAIGD